MTISRVMCLSLLLVTVPGLLAGCASSGNRKMAHFSAAQVDQRIVDGKTTKAQIRAELGDPNDMRSDSAGGETWVYSYTAIKEKASSFIPYLNLLQSGSDDTEKRLMIAFDHSGVVSRHTFSQHKNETRAGILSLR